MTATYLCQTCGYVWVCDPGMVDCPVCGPSETNRITWVNYRVWKEAQRDRRADSAAS